VAAAVVVQLLLPHLVEVVETLGRWEVAAVAIAAADMLGLALVLPAVA